VKLRLLYFGILRERLARSGELLDCEDGTTVGGLLELLATTHSIFALGAGSLRVAVNHDYSDNDRVLVDGDEVAILPPVAGGRSLR
jgi:molybdopterin converting factor subunit 1